MVDNLVILIALPVLVMIFIRPINVYDFFYFCWSHPSCTMVYGSMTFYFYEIISDHTIVIFNRYQKFEHELRNNFCILLEICNL